MLTNGQCRKLLIFLFLFVSPIFSQATNQNIIFTEIMYDAQGTDAGYEWVEIKNNFGYSKSLEGYKFCEGGSSVVCHSFKKENNPSFDLEKDAWAIITDDREKFKSKYNFSGLILESSGFTLTNTGETIELKDDTGNILDSLTYNPDSGGKDGNTLSLFDDTWRNGEATPGRENIEKNNNSDNGGGGGDDEQNNTNHSYVEISDILAGKKKLKAEIDEIKTIIAGARTKISGRAYGLSGAEINGVEFLWSLGDGSKDRGQTIYHEYSFPGKYLISLVVKSGHFTSPKTTQKIVVINPPIEISQVDFEKKFIEVKNNSNSILNLQDWILMMDGEKFVIPENTYILEKGVIKFTSKNTGLRFKDGYRVFLLYPNGEKFQEYKKIENKEKKKKKEGEDRAEFFLTNNKVGQEKKEESKKSDFKSNKNDFDKKKGITSKPKNLENKGRAREKILPSEKKSNPVFKENNSMVGQLASILPLKEEKNSFVKNNIIEISFFGFLLLLIFSLFFFKKEEQNNDLEKEAEEFEIIEK